MRKSRVALPICLMLLLAVNMPCNAVVSGFYGLSRLSDAQVEAEAKRIISRMTPDEKVAQLFFLPLQDADGEWYASQEDVAEYARAVQAGGYILFEGNITMETATRALVGAATGNSTVRPFIGIDEEGGGVSRLGALPGYENTPSAWTIGRTGDTVEAYRAGQKIGIKCRRLGINVDFAPVADIRTQGGSEAIGARAYGADASTVADMADAFQKGLHGEGVLSVGKHFPGHGAATADTHEGAAVLELDEKGIKEACQPFVRLIEGGAQFIMVGHISAPGVDKEGLPASVSPYFITEVLRGELNYQGIIVTDAMNMGAVTQLYAPGEATVRAILAGADMVLMPGDTGAALRGVKEALRDGTISARRLDESLIRIVSAKIRYGVIGAEAQ